MIERRRYFRTYETDLESIDPQITPNAANICMIEVKGFQTKIESILTKNHIVANNGNTLSIALTFIVVIEDDGTLILLVVSFIIGVNDLLHQGSHDSNLHWITYYSRFNR